MKTDDFDAAVGMTRKWDAREAGREVARNTIKKLKRPPSFFLLFSTIHYEKNGGFQEFLNGVWDVLPEGTPLVGGTVSGFVNSKGCYTRGGSALSVSYPNMDVASGFGKNTKRNPKKAAKHCSDMLNKILSNSNYPQKFVYELISGSLVPDLPGIRKKRVINNKILTKFSPTFSSGLLSIFQTGPGREEEVLSYLVDNLKDYYLLGGSSTDDNNMMSNYQFYGKKILTNSIVALGIRTDLGIDVNTTYGLEETDINLDITKIGRDKRMIKKINSKPALTGYLDAIGMERDLIDETLHHKTMFTPFGYIKNKILFPNVIGLCIGDNIVVGYQIQDKNLHLYSASGKSLINAVDKNLDYFKDRDNRLGLVVSCAARLETLGRDINFVRTKLLKFFDKAPFLLIYAGGEDTYIPNVGQRHINESFNLATINIEKN